ncbi:hypothetical protein [Amycolatopsis sp. H20-H5]|uniref:hypothetical protein n=1 Tax=Amycolatopsis sp. H20-H5 TaxID=3046309 RepID=UPI002DBD0E1D|nr:hypothetical protein [Amycolatopsis sp. H20-H5]MEC3978138.1 hypothetical protein [Amycolatopsis sp. H20-H5]
MQCQAGPCDVLDWFQEVSKKAEWWSALFAGLATLIALLAFIAAWRAAKAAIRTYRLQQDQLREMADQTRTMQHSRKDEALYGLSIWLSGTSAKNMAIKYVNTTGHPYYNIKLEISGRSDAYHEIPVLEPSTEPTEITDLPDELAQHLHTSSPLERPGITYQFDTFDNERYIRNARGGIHSAGGNILENSPRVKWRTWR